MKIHFVCRGNTFRSRLAEAYLKSKKIPSLTVSSSGIEAKRNLNGAIGGYTVDLLEEEGLEKYASLHWIQSTKEIIENQDVVIFMSAKQYDFCRAELGCDLKAYEIWSIADMPDELLAVNGGDQKKAVHFAQETFALIKSRVDEWLVKNKLVQNIQARRERAT